MKSTLLVILGTFWFSHSMEAQPIEIPDDGLHFSICMALNKSEGEITIQDMQLLIRLDASRQVRGVTAAPISSLVGLEHAINLKELNLSGSCGAHPEEIANERGCRGSELRCPPNLALNDFSLLRQLENLESLTLEFNHLSDIQLPSGLERLESLFLGGNRLEYLVLPQGMNSLVLLGLISCTDFPHNDYVWPIQSNPLRSVQIPVGMNLDQFELEEVYSSATGFIKTDILFYYPINMVREGDVVRLHWQAGVLQSASSLSDKWKDVSDAQSPHTLSIANGNAFFRVQGY